MTAIDNLLTRLERLECLERVSVAEKSTFYREILRVFEIEKEAEKS